MYKELISIIIPVYNSADTIYRTLKSISDQTYNNLEIIIVYKESQDDSLKIIQSVKDSRIKIVKQTKATGPGGARNIGIDCAKGDWIGFVEADDYIAPDFYEKLLNSAIKNNCEIAQGQIKYNDWCSVKKSAVYSKYYDKLHILSNGASFDKLFKSDLIKKNNIKFMENVRWEDNLFIFKALYYGKLVTVIDANYFYEPSAWNPEYIKKLKADILPVCNEIWKFLSSVKLTIAERHLAKRRIINCVAAQFIDDAIIYNGLMKILNNPLFLRIAHYKKILRQQKNKKGQKND